MKIRFTEAPTYVCENRHVHHDAHLEVFDGLVLEGAELTKDGAMFQVKLRSAFSAIPIRLDTLLAWTYWRWHWIILEDLNLDDFVYFPVESCEVIED